MTTDIHIIKLLNLIAAIFGLIGSLYLAKSLLALTPDRIISLTPPQSRWTYAPEQIEAMSFQKAESFVGILLISFAFIIQIIAIIIDSRINDCKIRIQHFLIIVACTIAFIVFAIIIAKYYGEYIKYETGKIPVKWHCDNYFMNEIKISDFKTFEKMVEDLLNIKINTDENEKDFIKRISKIVNWPLPNNYDQLIID